MTKEHFSAQNNIDGHPWIVEFSDLRVRNEQQRRVAENLDRGTLFSILEMFLRVATPRAKVLEQQGTAAMKIMFPNRAASRKFRSSLGGRLLSTGI